MATLPNTLPDPTPDEMDEIASRAPSEFTEATENIISSRENEEINDEDIPTIEEFKSIVQDWINYDEAIKTLQQQSRELRRRKGLLDKKIHIFMENQSIDNVKAKNKLILRKTTKRTQGLSKNFIFNKLNNILGEEQSQKLLSDLMSMREVKQVPALRIKTIPTTIQEEGYTD